MSRFFDPQLRGSGFDSRPGARLARHTVMSWKGNELQDVRINTSIPMNYTLLVVVVVVSGGGS